MNKTILTGILTSRIEIKFKEKWGGLLKPKIKKGSQLELTGTWSQGKDRPSFICHTYELQEASHG